MKQLFFILLIFLSTFSFAQNIVRVEYFIDTDPGFGNGTSVPLTPAFNKSYSNLTFNVPTQSGTHYLYIRAKHDIGEWGQTTTIPLFSTPTVNPSITKAEFFINNDPGIGLATNITIPAGQTTLNNISFNVPTASLTAGTDFLYIRTRDEAGRWSISHRQQLDNIVSPPSPSITRAEFFINNDPGIELATNITIPAGQTAINNISFNVPTASLTAGTDFLYIRTRDEQGRWSISHRQQLDNIVSPPNASITRAEFFINNDPGIGLATNITIPAGQTTLNNISFNVPTVSLTGGTDFLYLRTRDEAGRWSISHSQQLDNIVSPASPSITKAEFFINNDPGIGLATNITIPAGQTAINNISFNVPTASLTAGTDFLYIRTRDEQGRWSISHRQQLDNIVSPPNASITKAEFFVNNDPGIGLATTITIPTGQTTLSNVSFIVPTASLTGGIDFLYIRTRDEEGRWSISHREQLENIVSPPLPAITKAEFFVNNDPGIGLATNITIPMGQTALSNVSFNVPTASLTPGTDFLYIRTRDEEGRWSISHREQLENNVTPPSASITKAEFFINNDPGIGLATNITIPMGQTSLSNISFNVPIGSLTAGTDFLYIRTRDNEGRWSISHREQLENNVTPPSASITKAEFFINNDPGIGNATNITIPTGQATLSNISFNVPTASLTAGTDFLYIRTRDEEGRWSISHRQQLENIVTPPNPAITRVEYFFDNDPGFGNGTSLSIPTNNGEVNNIIRYIDAVALGIPFGNHFLYLRAKDELGRWSIVNITPIDIGQKNMYTDPLQSVICNDHTLYVRIYSDLEFFDDQNYSVYMSNASGSKSPSILVGTGQIKTGQIEKIVPVKLPNNISFGQEYFFYTETTGRQSASTSTPVTIVDTCFSCPLVVSNSGDNGINTLRYAINCALPGSTITFANNLSLIDLVTPLNVNKNIIIKDIAPNNLTINFNNNPFFAFTIADAALLINPRTNSTMENLKFTKTTAASFPYYILNNGTTTLKNISLIGSGNKSIYNKKTITFEGINEIK